MRQVTLKLTDPLGIEFTTTVPEEKLYDTMRYYGAKGCTSGEIPAGGLRLPLANEEDFDWRLIGARKYTIKEDGEEVPVVFYRGNSYKRRVLEPNKRIRERAIKYSRGARPTDPEHLKEGDDIQYVTLITFRGERARKDERWAIPQNGQPEQQ